MGCENLRAVQTGAESLLTLEGAVTPLRYEIWSPPGLTYRATFKGQPHCRDHASLSPPRVKPCAYQRPVLRASALGIPFRAARFFWISSSGST